MIKYFNEPLKEYRVAYLLDKYDETVKQSFRYHKLKRKDILAIEVLKNCNMATNQIMVETTSSLNFDEVNNKYVLLDGTKYLVTNVYTEETENYDGYVTRFDRDKKYLTLTRGN